MLAKFPHSLSKIEELITSLQSDLKNNEAAVIDLFFEWCGSAFFID